MAQPFSHLDPPLPQWVVEWQQQWPPSFRVLQSELGPVAVPGFYAANPSGALQHPQSSNWWIGVLRRLDYLLEWCWPMLSWDQLQAGDGLGPNLAHPELHTECCCLSQCSTWLKSRPGFKLVANGKHGKSKTSKSRGYVKATVGCFVDNTSEFYVHQLLCYAFYGPPPDDGAKYVVGHLCHHKLCMCPWHLAYMQQRTNVQMGIDHAAQLDYA